MIDLKTFESLLNITGFRRKRRDLTLNNLESMTEKQAQEMAQSPDHVTKPAAMRGVPTPNNGDPKKTVRFKPAEDLGMPEIDPVDLTITAAQRAINAEAAERERQSRERRAKLTQTRLESVVATGRFAG